MNTAESLVSREYQTGYVDTESENTVEALVTQEYKWGFVTDIEAETVPRGLNEDIIRMISAKKHEPDFMLEWRRRPTGIGRSWKRRRRSRSGPTSTTRRSTTRT